MKKSIYKYTFNEVEDNKVWKPKDGSRCWKIVSNGLILHDTYYGTQGDKNTIEIGNCFKTKEDAERAVEKLEALRRLREKGLKFKSWEANGSDITIHASIPDLNCTAEDVIALDLLFKEEN